MTIKNAYAVHMQINSADILDFMCNAINNNVDNVSQKVVVIDDQQQEFTLLEFKEKLGFN